MTLDELKEAVTEGWTVKITDHMYTPDSRDDAIIEDLTPEGFTLRPKQPWASQGRKFPTMEFRWSGDKELHGMTVSSFSVATGTTSRTWKGERYVVKSYTFCPPRGY